MTFPRSGPIRNGVLSVIVQAKMRSRRSSLWTTSNCLLRIQRSAERDSLSWNISTDVAIPNSSMNVIRSLQELRERQREQNVMANECCILPHQLNHFSEQLRIKCFTVLDSHNGKVFSILGHPVMEDSEVIIQEAGPSSSVLSVII